MDQRRTLYRRKSAEELFVEACAFAGDEACLLFCHGVICMELAKQQFESRFVSLSIRSLKKARAIAGRPLPIVSLLLAQGEASLGSKDKWEKYLQDEWFSWQQEPPAEIYFQMHLLSRQENSLMSYSALDSVQNSSRFILQAIHLNPSCLRY